MILHLAVLPGSKHHPLYLQRFCFLSHFDRASELRRCLGSYPHTLCKMSLSSSAYRTSVPGLQKGAPGIHSLPQRQRRLASPMQMPLLRAATKRKRRRRSVARTSRWLVLPLLLWLVRVVAHGMTSVCDSPLAVTRAIRGARCTTPSATVPNSAGKSRSLQNSSASNRSCSHATMAHLPNSGRASSRLSRRMTRMRRQHSRLPKVRSKPSTTTPTLTPAPTITARSSMSCPATPGTSRPSVSSRPCAMQSQRCTCAKGDTPSQVDGDVNQL
jgi:hypothetical protein